MPCSGPTNRKSPGQSSVQSTDGVRSTATPYASSLTIHTYDPRLVPAHTLEAAGGTEPLFDAISKNNGTDKTQPALLALQVPARVLRSDDEMGLG